MSVYSRLLAAATLALSILCTLSPAQAHPHASVCSDLFYGLHPALPLRPSESIKKIRLMTYNVRDFFLRVANSNESVSNPKPEADLSKIAKTILELDPDIMTLQEIGSRAALEDFARRFLDDRYSVHLTPGNDARHIGFLVKKDLPVRVELRSHHKTSWNDPTNEGRARSVFSRDVPALILRPLSVDTTDGQPKRPALIVLGIHGRSRKDRPGDPGGTLLRTAQIQATAKLIRDLSEEFGAETPLVVNGDFNSNVTRDPEFDSLKDLVADSFELLGIPAPQRWSHFLFFDDGRSLERPIDAILLNSILARSVRSALVYNGRANGRPRPLPQTREDVQDNPSDHLPVVTDVFTQSVFPEAFPSREEPRRVLGH